MPEALSKPAAALPTSPVPSSPATLFALLYAVAVLLHIAWPPVRMSAVIFYFFTFFHKLNADFLNPDMSCAVRFFEGVVSPFPALAALPGVELVVIWATLTAELCLAVGLAVPRWRGAACLLGAGFHLLLALDAAHVFYNFSAVMFAVLWVCLPADRAVRLARQPGGRVGRWHFLEGVMHLWGGGLE